MTGFRIGCDVGGTFTDLICVTPGGEVVLDKTPTTLDDQSVGVMNGVGQLAERFGLSLEEFCRQLDIVVHGTTTADNTMIEMNGANTGLLVTRGHRDEIEMRRVHKEAIWDPSYPAPTPIARRRVRIPIPERCAYSGEVLQPLDEEAVRAGIRRLKQFGCTSIAVMYLFSFVNPDHENRTLELIREEFPDVEHVSLSHDVMSAGPEFERVSTTLVNAYVAPRIAKYTTQLVESLRAAGYGGSVLIMQATGGVMPPDYVAKRAVTLLGSGPTGGVMGSAVAASAAGAADFVAVDMGGTSFDICLVRGGRPEVKTDRNWRYRYYIGIPMVDVQSVGAGGGSIARVRQGALLVGPESAGSQPGPACYGRGGTNATVTDADAVLGYLPVDTFADGRMTLDVAASQAAIERDVATPLGVDVVEAAWGIERIVNANMANAMRRVLSSYGADPRDLAMIAYGGNGPLHACALATELGAARVLVPKAAPAFSALGLLVADYVVDVLRSYVTPISQVEVERLRGLMSELIDEAGKELAPAGLPDSAVERELYVQMAYGGQNSDMSVPCPEALSLDDAGLLDLTQRFHDLHESDRGFAFRNQQPQVRGVRLIARGATTKPSHLAELGDVADATAAKNGVRPVYWGTEFVDTPVYDGRILAAGALITGPALVEEAFTVVAVAPGWTCTLDAHGRTNCNSHRVPAFFSEAELKIIAAAVDRLIPPDDEGCPGAAAAGAPEYIDNLLGAFTFDPPHIHAGGPFSGRWGGEASFENWLPLGAMEELAWRTRIEGSKGMPEREFNGPVLGLQQVYREALKVLGRDFVRVGGEEQDRRIASIPEFKSLLYDHTCEGMYGDPVYGGNRDRVGWTMIGWLGDIQPRGYTKEEVESREKLEVRPELRG